MLLNVSTFLRAPGYTWTQTEDTILITFETSSARTVVDINVVFAQHELRAGVEGEPLRVVGTLHHAVLPSECTWVLEQRPGYKLVEIHLQKSVPISWPYPMKEDADDSTPMDGQSEIELARHYESAGNLDSALTHLRRAADKGLAEAALTLGKLHQMGAKSTYRLSQDLEAAQSCYARAAALGSAEAMYLRGAALQEQGLHALAADSYKQAVAESAVRQAACIDRSRKGLPHYIVTSYFNLGIIYQDGSHDVPTNYDETKKWWSLAAQESFAPALYNLGVMFLNGTGGQRDEARAMSLFERAHQLNNKLTIPRARPLSTPVSSAPPPGKQPVSAGLKGPEVSTPRPSIPTEPIPASPLSGTHVERPAAREPERGVQREEEGGSSWATAVLVGAIALGIARLFLHR